MRFPLTLQDVCMTRDVIRILKKGQNTSAKREQALVLPLVHDIVKRGCRRKKLVRIIVRESGAALFRSCWFCEG